MRKPPRGAAINLRQLRYFATAVEDGSISRASARLKLAQTALSIQIRDLECAIGVRLLTRHSRGVRPTAAGSLLYSRYRELESFLELTLQEVREEGKATARPYVIGLNPSLMRLIGPDLLIDSAARTSALSVRLVEDLSFALVNALERREVDVAFAFDIDARPGLKRDAVMEDELLFVEAPGAAQSSGPISFAEAISHELFLAGDRGIVTLIRRTAERLSLEPRIRSDIQSITAIRSRIAEGGASLLPYGTAADGVASGVFATRRVDRPVLMRTLYLFRRRGEKADRAVEEFLRHIVERVRSASPYAKAIKDGTAR